MADDLSLTARLKLDTTAAEAGLKRFALGIGALVLGFDSLKKLVEGATTAFGDQQSATALLNLAMKDTSQKWTPALNKQLATTSDTLLKFGDSGAVVQNALQKLILRGVPAKAAIGDLNEIANIAAAKHIDLSAAIELVAKGASGKLSPALKELGATSLPKGVTGVKALNMILSEVKGHVAGAGAALAQTLPGQMDAFHAAITEKVLVPLGTLVNTALQGLFTWVNAHWPQIQSVITTAMTAISNGFTVVSGFVTSSLIPALSSLWGWFSTSILPILSQVAGYLTGDFAKAIGGLWKSMQNNVFPALKPVADQMAVLAGALVQVVEALTTVFLGGLKIMADNFSKIVPWLTPLAAGFVAWKGAVIGGEILTFLRALPSTIGGLTAFGTASKFAFGPTIALAAAIASMRNISGQFGTTGLQPLSAGESAHGHLGDIWSGFLNFLKNPTGPPHALGGPVFPGTSYRVGERGSELFTPRVPGYITPHNQLGGGTTIVNNVYVNNPRASANEIANAIAWKLKTAAV